MHAQADREKTYIQGADRQADRLAVRQTYRHINTYKETERHRDIHTYRQAGIQTVIHTDRQAGSQADIQTDMLNT